MKAWRKVGRVAASQQREAFRMSEVKVLSRLAVKLLERGDAAFTDEAAINTFQTVKYAAARD